jgi:hypothetical protein
MAKPKGSPKTGGRQKGVPNRRTEQREAAVQETAALIRTIIPHAFDGDSHALLMAVYKDPQQPLDLRMEAAKAAIAYEKPRLAAIEHGGSLGIITHEDRLREIDAMKTSLEAVVADGE